MFQVIPRQGEVIMNQVAAPHMPLAQKEEPAQKEGEGRSDTGRSLRKRQGKEGCV